MIVMKDKKDSIFVIIRQRERILYEGEAKAFSSYNENGLFDVIYRHANFISIINKVCRIHKFDGGVEEIEIKEGVLRVYNNKATIYLGILA